MAIPSPSFLLGLAVAFYLSTFVLFAIVRIITGVSIQRIGLSSLRRIACNVKDGVKVEIRGLGLRVHRPTFAQPTWLSLVITELRVTVDESAWINSQHHQELASLGLQSHHNGDEPSESKEQIPQKTRRDHAHRKVWATLTEIKNQIKRLHRIVAWIRLLDLVAERSSLVISGVGTVEIGSFLISVDTRPTTVDRRRIFQHNKHQRDEQRPAEWTLLTRSILYTPEGKESCEILDNCVLNIHGFLYQKVEGLRDASLALKLGRLHLPCDDFLDGMDRIKILRRSPGSSRRESLPDVGPTEAISQDAQHNFVLAALSEAQGFVASVLRGIREITVAVSFVAISKRVDFVRPTGTPLYVNMSMREIGFDVYRLDPSTPAHSMYFPRTDVAHQALLSAISFSVGLDDGHAHPERLLYIPMTTATIKTTLPAKLIQYADQRGSLDLNSNILLANLVITSPSIDLDPGHLPLFLAIFQHRRRPSTPKQSKGHPFIAQLLPKLSVKLSMHEPVFRVALPPVEPKKPGEFDFDLLISAVSSINMDVESSHSPTDNLRYAVLSNLRIVSHRLYYQTTSRQTHDLLVTESVELKTQITAAPDVYVVANANLQTLSTFIVQPSISKGVRQIVQQLRSDVSPEKVHKPKRSHESNFLRAFPAWLHHFELQGSDFNFEIAGVDETISAHSRGVALHLDGLTTEYKARKDESAPRPTSRRRAGSQGMALEEDIQRVLPPQPKLQKTSSSSTDGRRLAVHTKGLEAFIIESLHILEQKPFLTVPRSEAAFTTSNDGHSPIFHVNSLVKGIYLDYSLFRHYAIGVAVFHLRKTLIPPTTMSSPAPVHLHNTKEVLEDSHDSQQRQRLVAELTTVDLRVPFLQIKAKLPSDPYMMLHFEGFEAGRHRWTTPFGRMNVMRLYVDNPAIPGAWSRIVSIKNPRLDLREWQQKHGDELVKEKSIDFVSEVIRIGVPHQLVVHHIFDNCVNTMKTVAQLDHRFRTESNEYILAKHPEGPKHVPKISLRTNVLLFELEDSAFEWKLGTIYRTGLVEQKQRIAREEAFRVKARKLRASEQKNTPSSGLRPRNQRSRERGRSPSQERTGVGRSSSTIRSHPESPHSLRRGRIMRYDTEGACSFNGETRTTIEEARQRLHIHNAQSWKKRIDSALTFHSGALQDVRHLLWGLDSAPTGIHEDETILKLPERSSLMSLLMSDLHLIIDKPTFPMKDLPDFMHRVGKGLPLDTQFGLLIPLHAHFEMGETRIALRDYPLPLLHIPAIKAGQSARLASWSMKTNFVIGEEFRDFESTRDLQITVVPPEKMGPGQKGRGFAVDVRRTVSPVKTYSEMIIEINTADDTKITWGSSYQPAIQDVMQVIEGFTKPQIDPSDKVGFWDKIRLSFHSRISAAWKGDGDVHLMLKGSRDPYVVTGHGTGLIMIWRNNVRWNIWQENDPRKFMTVDSGDYVLAVPDFSHYARQSPEMVVSHAQGGPVSSHAQALKKVVMKLSGKVRWQAGLVFERNLEGTRRSLAFEPHYNVVLKNPAHIKSIKDMKTYDAFRGFRSNHIHMSIAVTAPSDRDWSLTNFKPSSNYNSVHLTPRFFTHFFSWWSMFSGVMSLPVRQGSLFPAVEKSGKKFGRHLATIKYSLLLSPLFISHVYKHKDGDEYSDDVVTATGLKMRLDSFVLDLHQRREEFSSEVKGLNKTVKTTGMRINQTLLDLVSADMRAVSASITGTTLDAVRHASNDEIAAFSATPPVADLSIFTIPDNDFDWIDVDDFVEIDWTLPMDSEPETKILPLAYAPRYTYRRQTDHHDTISGDKDRHSPFGYENTHHCLMSSLNDPRHVQIELVKERLSKIDELLQHHTQNEGEQHLRVVREVNDQAGNQQKLDELREHGVMMKRKRRFLKEMLSKLDDGYHAEARERKRQADRVDALIPDSDAYLGPEPDIGGLDSSTLADSAVDFNNRFVVHNAQIKWNNSLRNIMLRYIHQVSQRRGFVYYTSRRAVKFILDIIEEQKKSKQQFTSPEKDGSGQETPHSPASDDAELDVQARIQQLLDDANKFVNADDRASADGNRKSSGVNKATEEVSHDFVASNTYHLRLVAPQIQLQSEKNTKAVVLVTARGMRLKVIQILDKDRVADEVSGLVQTRFSAEMDNVQFFVTTRQLLSPDFLNMYSGNQYGASLASSWPPWAPIEAMFDFSSDTYGFSRVVQRTSASLRYDKYNQLRLKYNDNVTNEHSGKRKGSDNTGNQMDYLWVDFPHVRAICDSTQYYAIYIIVLDLLMWSEPLEKTRHERLEKIMLASDFSDLRGAPEMVCMLQARIRQLNEIKTHFHVNEHYLDRQGWQDRVAMEQDLASCEDELFFMMKAITTAQRKNDERTEGAQANGILRWYLSATEIVWHLTKEEDQPLAEFQLGNAIYERTDNSDGSNHNSVEVDRIYGISLLPNAIYPEIIAAHTEHLTSNTNTSQVQMLRVNWLKLEAIAGINVVDHFEVNLFPLQIQLEYETGRKLFEYVFPGMGGGEEGFSPFLVRHQLPQPEEEDEVEADAAAQARREAIARASKAQAHSHGPIAGSLESRLQPTHKLPELSRESSSASSKSKSHGLGIYPSDSLKSKFGIHPSSSKTSLSSNQKRINSRASTDNVSLASRGRDARTSASNGTHDGEKDKRKLFGLHRSHRSPSTESKKSKHKNADDLTQMLSRASNYMTLAYVKIPSVVLCLSYKGKGSRNFEDVHKLVFRMPTLEYRNKTWSNLDLALALKKDVIRALISHTGAIIGNKFIHHKPGKHQQSRLREIASSSVVLSSTELSRTRSAASSVLGLDDIEESPTLSDVTDEGGSLSRTHSNSSGRSVASKVHETIGQRRMSNGSLQPGSLGEMPRGDAVRQKLTRHLTGLKEIARRRESSHPHEPSHADEPEENSTPRKGTLKKIFASLDRS